MMYPDSGSPEETFAMLDAMRTKIAEAKLKGQTQFSQLGSEAIASLGDSHQCDVVPQERLSALSFYSEVMGGEGKKDDYALPTGAIVVEYHVTTKKRDVDGGGYDQRKETWIIEPGNAIRRCEDLLGDPGKDRHPVDMTRVVYPTLNEKEANVVALNLNSVITHS